jgi:hypothetical protein
VSRGRTIKHTHDCAVPDCKNRVPCTATPVIDDVDRSGHVTGHMSCEDHGPVDMLCDDHADAVPCVYCGAHGHDEACCEDAKFEAGRAMAETTDPTTT